MRNWLLVGAGLGVYMAVSMFVATDGNYAGVLAGLAIGVAVGTVGGLVRILLPGGHEPDALVVDNRAKLLTALGVIPLAIGGVVRVNGGSAVIYLVLVSVSIVLFVVASRMKKQDQ